MKKIFFLIILLITPNPVQAVNNLKDSILTHTIPYRHFYKITDSIPVIQIQCNKKTYLVGEPIWVEVEVNIDSDVVVSQIPHICFMGDVYFEIKNDKDEKVNFQHYEVDYLYLKPYHLAKYYYVEDMLALHGEPDDFPSSQLLTCYKINAGTYTIAATLTLTTDKKEYFHTEPVEIEIVDPEGDELNARKKLLDIYTIETDTSLKLKEKYNLIESEINNFISLFQNSVYTGKLLTLLDNIKTQIELPWSNESRNFVINYYLSEIKKYPDSYYNFGKVDALGYYLNDVSELQKISSEYKGTLLEKIIFNYICWKFDMEKHGK